MHHVHSSHWCDPVHHEHSAHWCDPVYHGHSSHWCDPMHHGQSSQWCDPHIPYKQLKRGRINLGLKFQRVQFKVVWPVHLERNPWQWEHDSEAALQDLIEWKAERLQDCRRRPRARYVSKNMISVIYFSLQLPVDYFKTVSSNGLWKHYYSHLEVYCTITMGIF